jgi:hypothetical protein
MIYSLIKMMFRHWVPVLLKGCQQLGSYPIPLFEKEGVGEIFKPA